MRFISPYSELFIRVLPRCRSSESFIALRQATSQALRRKTTRRMRAFQRVIASTIWPMTAGLHATGLALKHGRWAYRESGTNPWRQWREMIDALLTDCRLPRDYYFYRHFLSEQRAHAPFYMSLRESCRTLGCFNGPADHLLFKDKIQFATHCHAKGLPTPEILAAFKDHQLQHPGQPDKLLLPACDLFAKRTDGVGGQGAHRWECLSPDHYRDHHGRRFTSDQIIEHLKRVSKPRRPHLLQRRVINDPVIARLSNGSLATFRIMTVRPGPRQAPVFLAGILRLPHGQGITDNQAQETPAILCPIDARTGVVGIGRLMQIRGATYTHHPDTHQPIQGVTIPDWKHIQAFCVDAHAKLWPHAAAGWDIALTPQGLTIIEANHVPSVETIQIAHARPLGDTLLVESLLNFAHDYRSAAPMASSTPVPADSVMS